MGGVERKREPLSDERSDEFRFAPRDDEPFSVRFDSLEFLLLFAQAKSRVKKKIEILRLAQDA
jgi:hypothetical protein